MTTRNQFIDSLALFKRQSKKAKTSIGKWVPTSSAGIENHEIKLRAYLAGEADVVHLSSYLGYLRNDYLVPFEHALLQTEGGMHWQLLAISARYGLSSALVGATRVIANERGAGGPTGRGFALILGTLLISGWKQPVGVAMQAIREGLDSPFVNWSQLPFFYPHFKFLVLLVADGQGQPLDRTVYGFTARDMKDVPAAVTTYETVLANWRSTDLDQVQRLVGEMADFHVISSTKDMEAFSSQSEYLFPYEILAFLRMREWAGLENPKSFEHPLMNTPLAVLPPAPLPWPEDPLLDAAIAKFKTEYPAQNYFDRLAAQT